MPGGSVHATSERRKDGQSLVDGFAGSGPTRPDLESEILSDGVALEDTPSLRYQAEAARGAFVRCLFGQFAAIETNDA
jgi:hypothetical protein